MESDRVGEGVGLAVDHPRPGAVLDDVGGGVAQEIEAHLANELGQLHVGTEVGIVVVGVVEQGGADQEGRHRKRRHHPHRLRIHPPTGSEPGAEESAPQTDDEHPFRNAREQPVDEPGIHEQPERGHGREGSGEKRRLPDRPPRDAKEEHEEEHEKSCTEESGTAEGHPAALLPFEPHPVEAQSQPAGLGRIDLEPDHEGRGRGCLQRYPTLVRPIARLEGVHHGTPEGDLGLSAFGERPRESIDEPDRAGQSERQVDHRVEQRPVDGVVLVDLVLGSEALHVGAVARTQTEADRPRVSHAIKSRHEGRPHQDEKEDRLSEARDHEPRRIARGDLGGFAPSVFAGGSPEWSIERMRQDLLPASVSRGGVSRACSSSWHP